MRNRKVVLGMLILLIAAMLCGCGEQLYELTEEETNSIAAYVAHVVSKHNTRQNQGIVSWEEPQEETENESVDQESTELDASQDGNAGTEEIPADEQEDTLVSLQEVLAVEGLDASFDRYEVREDYIEGDYYAIDAPAGSRLLVLYFSLTNSGETDVACDILSRSAKFQVTVNDTYQCTSDVTILLDDLSTYQGTVPAGTTQNTVLLFTMPSEELDAVDHLIFTVTENGSSRSTQLK
ncbi:MAG: hypothetical protein ACI4DO_09720 [Roseburia sp.]